MKYGVTLLGENFELLVDGIRENYGFVTTRFVSAGNPEEAEIKAVEMIRQDQTLQEALLKEGALEPMIYLEELWEEKWWKKTGGKGYSFYNMNSEEDV